MFKVDLINMAIDNGWFYEQHELIWSVKRVGKRPRGVDSVKSVRGRLLEYIAALLRRTSCKHLQSARRTPHDARLDASRKNRLSQQPILWPLLGREWSNAGHES